MPADICEKIRTWNALADIDGHPLAEAPELPLTPTEILIDSHVHLDHLVHKLKLDDMEGLPGALRDLISQTELPLSLSLPPLDTLISNFAHPDTWSTDTQVTFYCDYNFGCSYGI